MNDTKIRIYINELGPIRDSWVDFAPLMLFTGASSLGKSYTNFLAYYIIDLFCNNGISGYLHDKIAGKLSKQSSFDVTFSIGNLRNWMKQNVVTYFRRFYNFENFECSIDFIFSFDDSYKITFKINREDNNLGLENVSAYRVLLGERQSMAFTFGEARPLYITSHMGLLLSQLIFGRSFSRAILMPPGRSVLIDNTFSVQSAAANMGMYNKFLQDFDYIQHADWHKELAPDQQFYKSRIQRLIHGEVINDKDGTKIKMPNGRSIPISAPDFITFLRH